MALVKLLLPCPYRVVQSTRRICNSVPVQDADGDPAAGRTMLVLGRNDLGIYFIVAETRTDSNGDYLVDVPAGDNDEFIVVAVGDGDNGEYTRVFGNIRGVV